MVEDSGRARREAGGVAAVRTEGLAKRFGRKWALAHVDLDVRQGEGLLIVGDNGSGKTTLLRLLAGLLRPTLGNVAVCGASPQRAGGRGRAGLSLVGHQGYLYDALTPIETVSLWDRLLGGGRSRSQLADLLDEAGLGADRDSRVHGFSAGMRKRLSLTRLRLEQPRVVLLDEPFSALDEAGRGWLGGMLDELRTSGAALLIASHDPERAKPFCTRGLRLEGGQIAWHGSAAEVGVPG